MLELTQEQIEIIEKYKELEPMYNFIMEQAKQAVLEDEVDVQEAQLSNGMKMVFTKIGETSSTVLNQSLIKETFPDWKERFGKVSAKKAYAKVEFVDAM